VLPHGRKGVEIERAICDGLVERVLELFGVSMVQSRSDDDDGIVVPSKSECMVEFEQTQSEFRKKDYLGIIIF
jgi:hypothetical protein